MRQNAHIKFGRTPTQASAERPQPRRHLGLRDLPDALPGRTETIELWPLSQGEIDDAPDGFVDHVFTQDLDTTMRSCALRKHDYVDRALRGGYPEAMRRDPGRRRNRFFDSYITDLIT
ncbi:hypothetical protein [Nonomuraea rubra]|uniref:Putative AAA+ superfamily ATPase n=1 Tax=Nonomuraea rubra TaxID=46180 RepID=A0A7X0NQL5_9ACTN|nr:hypothetical protein [Nonomuraea rubra]MBB6547825.1 putative AAA+ superfamily ATPase [Nonomuraea rubra]